MERGRYPSIQSIADGLGGATEVQAIPIPVDCVDGFTEAYYARPEALLDPAVRRSQSAWSFVSEEEQMRFVKALSDDLKSGAWEQKFGKWRTKPYFEGSLRLIVSRGRKKMPPRRKPER